MPDPSGPVLDATRAPVPTAILFVRRKYPCGVSALLPAAVTRAHDGAFLVSFPEYVPEADGMRFVDLLVRIREGDTFAGLVRLLTCGCGLPPSYLVTDGEAATFPVARDLPAYVAEATAAGVVVADLPRGGR